MQHSANMEQLSAVACRYITSNIEGLCHCTKQHSSTNKNMFNELNYSWIIACRILPETCAKLLLQSSKRRSNMTKKVTFNMLTHTMYCTNCWINNIITTIAAWHFAVSGKKYFLYPLLNEPIKYMTIWDKIDKMNYK